MAERSTFLAGPGVLLGHPPSVHQQPAVIVDQHEEFRSARAGHPGVGDERADEHVADPDLIRARRLVTAEDLGRLRGQRGTGQSRSSQMCSHRALGQQHAVGPEDGINDLG
jgi:hypothetical protein